MRLRSTATPARANTCPSWSIAVPCAMGSRLLLNMRERYYRNHTGPSVGIVTVEEARRGGPDFRVVPDASVPVARGSHL